MGVLGKLREKLSRRRPHEDLRDYEEIERMRREQERLRKLREEVMQKEREKVLKQKWKHEARKKAESEAYGILTPSRKAAIVRMLKKAQKPKRKKGKKKGNTITIRVEAGSQPRKRTPQPEVPLFGAGLFEPVKSKKRKRDNDLWWWLK